MNEFLWILLGLLAVGLIVLSVRLDNAKRDLRNQQFDYIKVLDDLRLRLMAIYLDGEGLDEFGDKYPRLDAHLRAHQVSRRDNTKVDSSLSEEEKDVWHEYCEDLWYKAARDIATTEPDDFIKPAIGLALNIKKKQKSDSEKKMRIVEFATFVERVLNSTKYTEEQKIKKVKDEVVYVQKEKRWP